MRKARIQTFMQLSDQFSDKNTTCHELHTRTLSDKCKLFLKYHYQGMGINCYSMIALDTLTFPCENEKGKDDTPQSPYLFIEFCRQNY